MPCALDCASCVCGGATVDDVHAVCVCVCVCGVHPRVCHASRPGIALPGRGGGCCRSAPNASVTVNAAVRPVCCPASLAAVHACSQSCAVQGGSSQRACVVKPLVSALSVRVCCVCRCSDRTIDGGRWALCMCVPRGKPRCVSSD